MMDRRRRAAVYVFVFGLSIFTCALGTAYAQRVVTYQTEDALTIQATLHLPSSARPPFAGVVLLAEPGWIIRSTFDTANLGRDLAQKEGMAVLTVDFRGTASNVNGRHFSTFSPAQVDKLQLDVRAAVKFLGSQAGVDPQRIGVVGVGRGANYAVLEAAESPAVQALVLISGTLGEDARRSLTFRSDIPVLCLAAKDDKEGFREMADAFYLSKNSDSDFMLGQAGHGTVMFNRTDGLGQKVVRWLAANVKGLGSETEISFTTEDGWNLHGRLRLPDGSDAASQVPAVLLVHGAMHDQDTYRELTRALAKKRIATLTYDWRGKNRDVDDPKGHYGVDLKKEDEDKTYLDVKAALNFLASQKGVDPNRIGIVGATWGTVHSLHGATGDDRVKAMALMSQYVLDDRARQFLASTDVPIFFIASSEDLNSEAGNLADFTREAYHLSKNQKSEFLLFDDAGRGSEMLKRKPEIGRMIVRWMEEKLGK